MRRAFTLIELLVVISIIALLIALLLPSLENTRYATRLTMCGTNLKQIAIGSNVYATDNDLYYPNGPSPNDKGDISKYGMSKYEPMRKQSNAAPPYTLGPYVGGSVRQRGNEVMNCPEVRADQDLRGFVNYQIYYTCTSSLKSGADSVTGAYGLPKKYAEAMPRIDDERITQQNGFFGGGNWASTIIASDVAQENSGLVASNHMKGGQRFTYDFGKNIGIREGKATSNYVFRDGHVDRESFSRATFSQNMMAASSRDAGAYDKFLLPKRSLRRVP